MWFFDFIYYLTNQLLTDKKKSFSSICSEAYKESLAPHHSFTLKTVVKAGLYTVGRYNTYINIIVVIISIKLFLKKMKIKMKN